jgi:hypothetical protein
MVMGAAAARGAHQVGVPRALASHHPDLRFSILHFLADSGVERATRMPL